MLANNRNLLEGFRKVQEKTLSSYPKEIENLLSITRISNSFFEFSSPLNKGQTSNRYSMSLLSGCEWELVRTGGQIVFLTTNALYRNAKSDIRFMLESAIQAYYIDSHHPDSILGTKWEILKEVEGKREYRAANLIDCLKITHKEDLQWEYKLLSKEIHASHASAKAIFTDVMNDRGIPANIDPKEILAVENSLVKLYDIFYFLFFSYFNECIPDITRNQNIREIISKYNLRLTDKMLSEKTLKK